MPILKKIWRLIKRIVRKLFPCLRRKHSFGEDFPPNASAVWVQPPITPRIYEVFPQTLYTFVEDILCHDDSLAQILILHDETRPQRAFDPGLYGGVAGSSESKCHLFTIEQCGASTGLPPLGVVALRELFRHMVDMEHIYERDMNVLKRHPKISDSDRVRHVRWISKSCRDLDVSKRKFHVAVDMMDRYLSAARTRVNVKTYELIRQASFKLAFREDTGHQRDPLMRLPLTSNATPVEMRRLEEDIYRTLCYRSMPVTTDMWLAFLLQCCKTVQQLEPVQGAAIDFFNTNESQKLFVACSRICSACVLDTYSLKYSYRLLASSALWLFLKSPLVFKVSVLAWEDIASCVVWLLPFYLVVTNGTNNNMDGLKYPWGSPQYWQLDNFPYTEVYIQRAALSIEKALGFTHPQDPRISELLERIEELEQAAPYMEVMKTNADFNPNKSPLDPHLSPRRRSSKLHRRATN